MLSCRIFCPSFVWTNILKYLSSPSSQNSKGWRYQRTRWLLRTQHTELILSSPTFFSLIGPFAPTGLFVVDIQTCQTQVYPSVDSFILCNLLSRSRGAVSCPGIQNGYIPFRCARAMVSCMLAHWCGLLTHQPIVLSCIFYYSRTFLPMLRQNARIEKGLFCTMSSLRTVLLHAGKHCLPPSPLTVSLKLTQQVFSSGQ